MEAPETIFVNNIGYGCLSEPCTERMFASQIEYVRKDAFIKKVCDYFAPYISDNSGGYDRARIIENFKRYIRGE